MRQDAFLAHAIMSSFPSQFNVKDESAISWRIAQFDALANSRYCLGGHADSADFYDLNITVNAIPLSGCWMCSPSCAEWKTLVRMLRRALELVLVCIVATGFGAGGWAGWLLYAESRLRVTRLSRALMEWICTHVILLSIRFGASIDRDWFLFVTHWKSRENDLVDGEIVQRRYGLSQKMGRQTYSASQRVICKTP